MRIRRPAPKHTDYSYAALKHRNDYQLSPAEAELLGVPWVDLSGRS